MEKNFNIAFIDILRFIWRGLLNALIAGAAVALLVYVISSALPPTYEARSTILIASDSSSFGSWDVIRAQAPKIDVSAYRTAVLSASNIEIVMQALIKSNINTKWKTDINTKSIEKFRKAIKIHLEAGDNSSNIEIIAKGKSPQEAQAIANLMAQSLVIYDKERFAESSRNLATALEHQIALLDSQIEALRSQRASASQIQSRIDDRNRQQDQLSLARAQVSSPAGLVTIIESALLPYKPSAPKPLLNAIISFILASIISYGLLHLYESISSNSLNKEAEDLGLPVLASFPKITGRKLPKEATNYLRTNLLHSSGEQKPKIILVTSPKDHEGKTSVAISLAESFVRNNNSTLLVDANLRHPSIAKAYKLMASRLGHTSIETWLGNPREAKGVVRMPVNDKSLFIIPSFGSKPELAEQLGTNLKDALESWKNQYDIIIFDSPAVLKVADSLAVAPYSTDTILVVDKQKSGPKQLKSAINILKRANASLSGVILTNTKVQDLDMAYAVDLESNAKPTGLKMPKFNKPKTGLNHNTNGGKK